MKGRKPPAIHHHPNGAPDEGHEEYTVLLTAQTKRESLTSGSRLFVLVLLAITLATAIPRILFGISEFIEYDGYWHIFIAQQDTWPRFWQDVYDNAHPPLFFLLLKVALHFGRNLLVYRSISLISGIVSVYLVGSIARKLTQSEARGYQAALAYGFAMPAIIIACEVRSYMLSVVFVLASFSALIDIALAEDSRAEIKARAAFAIWAILACLSEYFAFFYCGAALLLLFGRFALSRKTRVAGRQPQLRMEIATAAPVVALIAILYFSHAAHLATIQGHLLPYYFDRHGMESVGRFVLRNSTNLLNSFLPLEGAGSPVPLMIGVLAILAGIAVAFTLRRRNDGFAITGRWTLAVTTFTLFAIIAAAIDGKYPYGGDLRQQFILFPLLVLSLAVAIEVAARYLARKAPNAGRLAANVVLASVAAGVGIAQYVQYPKVSTNVLEPQMADFDHLEPTPAAVYLDQFNLITFFLYHHDWKWSIAPQQPVPNVDIFRLRKGSSQMLVFRDKERWDADPDDSALYKHFAQGLQSTPQLSLFSVRQSPPKSPFESVRSVESEILKDAANAGICVQRFFVNPTEWYVTFRQSGCPVIKLAPENGGAPAVTSRTESSGQTDDSSVAIQYVGAWTHRLFYNAYKDTLSYSKDAGGLARFVFDGPNIVYGFTKAANRGIAEVRIDGISKGKLDLYAPSTQWQQQVAYDGLGPGKHTLEVVITGNKNPKSTDTYIDVDWLATR